MDHTTCDAKTRSGNPCQLRAGWGTDHVGEGRCKFHGGRTPRGADSPHFRHGHRSAYFDPSTIVGFDEWEREIGPTFQLERDLLAMIYVAREKLLSGEPIQVMTNGVPVELVPDPDYLTRCLERVSRSWERMVKRHEGETIHVKLAQPEILKAFRAVGEAVARHVSDPAEAAAVAADVQAALQQLALEEWDT